VSKKTAAYLPPLVEQGRLVRDLRALIERRGFATFVSAPLLEPRGEHFPDRWRPDALGVERLALRLLSYAGLPELQVDVELYQGERDVKAIDAGGNATQWSHKGAAAWFAGINGDRCLFGAEASKLDTPDMLAGVMAHEVAHAFRHHHHLNGRERQVEEELTDLTTVYLGFGMLTTNASYRYRAEGEIQGSYTRMRWSHHGVGYLSPQAMSFLLAVQVVVRDLPAGERRRLAALLETNQATYFKAACASLERATLIERLGLPPPAEWPAPVGAAPQAFDTSSDPPLALPSREEVLDEIRTRFQGMPVFRVGASQAGRFLFFGMVSGMAAGVAVGIAIHSGWALLALVLVGSLAGWVMGRRRPFDQCSDCDAIIPADAPLCPGCGGQVSGRIAHRNLRLDAREALEGGGQGDDDDEDFDENVEDQDAEERRSSGD
jgi:hypothetical protein